MREFLVAVLFFSACTTRLELPVEPRLSDEEAMAQAFARADDAMERQMREALTPGITATQRRARLESGSPGALLDEGRWLFVTDSPWHGNTPAPVRPLHLEGQTSADGTRCMGCHHTGGPGGAGAFADRTFIDAKGDDVTTATVRAPRMLAGAAVLELLGAEDSTRVPFGWAPGGARTLRAHVERGVRWHLGEDANDLELDALVMAIAAMPLPIEEPMERDSLRQRLPHGRERFTTYGCASCHTPSLPLTRFDLPLSGRRMLALESSIRAQLGAIDGPVAVPLWSDLKPHDLGAGTFVTPPLWGIASRLTFLHDGRASTLDEAIRAHEGEAAKARADWEADQEGRRDLTLFLLTLTRPTRLESSL